MRVKHCAKVTKIRETANFSTLFLLRHTIFRAKSFWDIEKNINFVGGEKVNSTQLL